MIIYTTDSYKKCFFRSGFHFRNVEITAVKVYLAPRLSSGCCRALLGLGPWSMSHQDGGRPYMDYILGAGCSILLHRRGKRKTEGVGIEQGKMVGRKWMEGDRDKKGNRWLKTKSHGYMRLKLSTGTTWLLKFHLMNKSF